MEEDSANLSAVACQAGSSLEPNPQFPTSLHPHFPISPKKKTPRTATIRGAFQQTHLPPSKSSSLQLTSVIYFCTPS